VTILSDGEIQAALDQQEIVIAPRPQRIQPASVDLHLGEKIGLLHKFAIDRYAPEPLFPQVSWYRLDPHRPLELRPGEFLLCSTLETVTIPPDLIGILTGKSTLARDSLQIECAGFVDPGWSGVLTLEIVNLGPAPNGLRLGQPICQIHFQRLGAPARRPYGHPDLGSHYQGAEATQAGFSLPTPPSTRSSPRGPGSRHRRTRTPPSSWCRTLQACGPRPEAGPGPGQY
jgi:dCTP deaminase